ncbi:MAG: DUF1573 domain-containing protein [Saprospiraceae bacterium]
MKITFISTFSFFFLCLLMSCTAQTTKPMPVAETPKPRNWAREMLKWDQDFVEYGKVKKGETRDHTYRFTNISKENVEINMCTACSCTTLDWTTKVIKPGEKGEIITHFDSKEKDKSETISITIILKNTDLIMNYPIIDEVKFHFDLIQD